MKISNNAVQLQAKEVAEAKRAQDITKADIGKSDSGSEKVSDAKAEISGRAQQMAQAKQLATEARDVREEKIAELKERIQSGKYNIKPDAIAERMVREHMTSKGLD